MQTPTEAADPLTLDPRVAEVAAKIRKRWTRSTRYLRQRGVVTLNGQRVEPERLAKILQEQSRYVAPYIKVYACDRYKFGMSCWRQSAWHI